MNNTIIAVDNEKILKKLNNNIKNILYREAILEILKKNKQIKTIIISKELPGEISFEDTIRKVKKINKKIDIIVIINNKDSKENLYKLGIEKIFYKKELNKIINEKKSYKEIKNNFKIFEKISKKITKNNNDIKIDNKERKIIFIYGKQYEERKIVELINIRKINNNKKTLIINIVFKSIKINEIKIIGIKKATKKAIYKIDSIINNKIKVTSSFFILNKYVKKIIKNNKEKNIIFNINYEGNLRNIITTKKYINIWVEKNSKNTIKKIQDEKEKNKEIIISINNYNKNNISKYMYLLFKSKYKKIIMNNY